MIHNRIGKAEYVSYRGNYLVEHAVLLKILYRRLSDYCKMKGVLQNERCGFGRDAQPRTWCLSFANYKNSANDKRFRYVYKCFIDLMKGYDSVNRTLL